MTHEPDLRRHIDQVAATASLHVLRLDAAVEQLARRVEYLDRAVADLRDQVLELHDKVERVTGGQRL